MSDSSATPSSPTVSVCIPARNAAAYLAQTLDSVRAQSSPPLEILVCDNASSDETAEICRRYAVSGVRHHRFEEPLGQAGNWNRCIDLARGTCLVLLHADDLLAPDFLRQAVESLERHPNAAFVHSTVELIGGDGQPLGVRRVYADDRIDNGAAFFRRLLTEGCLVNPAGVMLRTASLRRAGPFTTSIRWGIDWHMWMRVSLLGDVSYLSAPLAKYRLHAGSGTTAVLASGRVAADELWAVEDVLRLAALEPGEHRRLALEASRGVAHRTWCHAEQACREGSRRASAHGLAAVARVDVRFLADRRFWGLLAGVALGYPLYDWLHRHLGRSRATRNRNESQD